MLASLIVEAAGRRQIATGGQGPQMYALDLQVSTATAGTSYSSSAGTSQVWLGACPVGNMYTRLST